MHKPPPREESHQCHRCDTEGIAVAGSDHCALGKKGIFTLQIVTGDLRHGLLLWYPVQACRVFAKIACVPIDSSPANSHERSHRQRQTCWFLTLTTGFHSTDAACCLQRCKTMKRRKAECIVLCVDISCGF